jgi:hypothetical protein
MFLNRYGATFWIKVPCYTFDSTPQNVLITVDHCSALFRHLIRLCSCLFVKLLLIRYFQYLFTFLIFCAFRIGSFNLDILSVTLTVYYSMRKLRLSRRWRFKSSSSGLWRHVVVWYDEDGGSKIVRNVVLLPQHYTASQPRRPRREIYYPFKNAVNLLNFCMSCNA